MRHFHNTQHNKGIFYTMCNGTLSTNVDLNSRLIAKNPIRALASCLEIPHQDLVDYVAGSVVGKLAPNEERAIDEFVAFHRLVESTLDGPAISEYGEVHCFQYTNLNEGKSVVWFLYS
uniref:Uncharacterized protein n=1 Tax=Leviviridae sp. TaxID=2027243 RepID=A0A514DAQ3_9VIRU|nr:MAG: hypothetical protein H2Rhizo33428_000001 [Leviviridae sp.]